MAVAVLLAYQVSAEPADLRRWGWQALVVPISESERWVTFSDGTSIVCEREGELWSCPHPAMPGMLCVLDGQVWCVAPQVRRGA